MKWLRRAALPRGAWRRGLLAIVLVALAIGAWLRLGPLPEDLLADVNGESTVIVDRTGAPLYEALSQDGTRAVALSANELPPMLVAATVAAEDRRFWVHPGLDPIAMVRALRVNAVERRIVEGGSTISQQAAKLLLSRKDPERQRGWRAKIFEAVLALRLEHRFTKAELLALYLNHAAYGNQIVGVERASRAYFGVPAKMLTPAQAAFLAALPQRPTRFNPYRNRALAVARQRTVLSRMTASGVLSPEAAERARAEELVFSRAARPFDAPHFVEMVLAATPSPRPARIETTLDLQLQRSIAGIVETSREQLTRHGAHNVAVVVLDNASGEWLAWEGSGNYPDADHGGRMNGPVIPRQPGSALKPFTYAVAFEHGFTPASVLTDEPMSFPTADPFIAYTPRNYDGTYRGRLSAREALAMSQNIPAVLLASEVGVPALLRTLTRAGLSTFEKNAAHYGLGVTLGNAEVRLDELVAAYAAFARGGMWIAPAYLANVEQVSKPVVSPQTAFWITDILSDPEAREAVFGRGGYLDFPFPVAVKTGTSQAYHDNWTIGYSRHVTVGVWVGNFNRAPLRNSSGVTGAAPIFHAVMLAAEARVGGSIAFGTTPIVARTSNLETVQICALSGRRATEWCPIRKSEWLAAEHVAHACDTHVPDTPARRVSGQTASATLAIESPANGSTYLIDPTLRREFQAVSLRARTVRGARVEWFVNDVPAGASSSGEDVQWPLTPGQHRITARDARGRTAHTTIVVR